MPLAVADAARRLGVSNRAVVRMIKDGHIRARGYGRRYAIEAEDLPAAPRIARPMSDRIAWAAILGPEQAHWLTKAEKARTLRQLRLAFQNEEALRIASWLAGRGRPQRFDGNLARLLADPRVVPSGPADHRALLTLTRQRDVYTQPGVTDAVIADHNLQPANDGQIWLRPAVWDLPRPAPLILVVADLVDHGQEAEAKRLLRTYGGHSTLTAAPPSVELLAG